MSWLNPKGIRESNLLRQLRQWLPELEAGIHRRRIAAGLEIQPENEEPMRRARPVRKVAAGSVVNGDTEEGVGYQGWRVSTRSIGFFGFKLIIHLESKRYGQRVTRSERPKRL